MKESDFIRQNKEKWQEFEQALASSDSEPSRTSKLFLQITDDLSYARTFYPHRSVRLYLNGVARLLFNDLNKSRTRGWRDFAAFWTRDLPLGIYRARRAMLISFLVFVACFTLGMVTSMHDSSFASSVLGARYVAVTEDNIAKGDPMAIYKTEGELRTFLPILLNNLKVDFVVFFSGIFMAVGSLVVMVGNGVMVGVFQYFFIERGLLWESFLGIWTHGALEIPTIILSGGAGLTLGRGLLFPGTYSRMQAFRTSAMQGLVIILGVVPLTFIAALVEGFLTRHTDIPDAARLAFIILSLTAVLAYYFFYPRRIGARTAEKPPEQERTLLYREEESFDPSHIRTAGKLISETFHYLFKISGYISAFIFSGCAVVAVLVAWNPQELLRPEEGSAFGAEDLTAYAQFPALLLLCVITVSLINTFTALRLKKTLFKGSQPLGDWPAVHGMVTTAAVTTMLAALFLLELDLALLFAVLLFPFGIYLSTVSAISGTPIHKAAAQGASLASESPGKLIATLLFFALFSTVLYVGCVQGLRLVFLSDALSWMLTSDDGLAERIETGLFAFQTMLCLTLFVALTSVCSVLLYHTLLETGTAEGLLKKIGAI